MSLKDEFVDHLIFTCSLSVFVWSVRIEMGNNIRDVKEFIEFSFWGRCVGLKEMIFYLETG
jgi:hypothetical protein